MMWGVRTTEHAAQPPPPKTLCVVGVALWPLPSGPCQCAHPRMAPNGIQRHILAVLEVRANLRTYLRLELLEA